MTINKVVESAESAVADVPDGATLMVSGFGDAGCPSELLEVLARRKLKGLTVISNNAGSGRSGLAALLAAGSVDRIVCSYPRSAGSVVFEELLAAGRIEVEICPQGTLSERIRAGGAGIGGFYTRSGAGTVLTQDRETRVFEGHHYVLELPLHADFTLLRAAAADRWGNLVYRHTTRNFGPTMATAAAVTIAQVERVVPLGELGPEVIITPGIFVDRVVLARG